MTPYQFGSWIGAFIGTLAFTKLAFWLTRSWPDALPKLATIYVGLSFVLVLADAYSRSQNGFVDVVHSATMFLP